MKRIESRNNPTVKNIISLRQKRERDEAGAFYFEGVHLLEEYLRAGDIPKTVFVREDVTERYAPIINKLSCEVCEVTASVYDKITEEKAPQGILTLSPYLKNVFNAGVDLPYEDLASKIKNNCIILVDLQDNGNVGTIIRTAAALSCDIMLCGSCADIYSPKTVRATMGALFTSEVFVCRDTKFAISCLQKGGKRVIASALRDDACLLGNFKIENNDCFVIGNEGQGLSQEVIAACNLTALIPMSGKTESLNAASAASVIMWEAKRNLLI